MTWKIFEHNVYEYLANNICINNISIVHMGDSNSTVSDFDVYDRGNKIFTIECKKNISQASQFVVINDVTNEEFRISTNNKSVNDFTGEIIEHMNDNYEYYSKEKNNENTQNKLMCSKKLMFKRVKSQLKSKAKFITSSNFENNFSNKRPLLLIPIEDIENYFDISGIYRTKRSGSSKLPKKNYPYFENKYKTFIEENKIYIKDPNNTINPDVEEGFYFSESNSEGLREIRKKGKTANSNVIFSLTLKNNFRHTDLKTLSNYIKLVDR